MTESLTSIMIYGEFDDNRSTFKPPLMFNNAAEIKLLHNLLSTCISKNNPVCNTTLIEKTINLLAHFTEGNIMQATV